MEKHVFCVSLLLLVLLVGLSECSPRRQCCTEYQENPIPAKYLKYYTIQDVRHFCNIKAVLFTTVRNRLVCGNPDSKWVIEALETVPDKHTYIHGGHLKKSS